VSLTEPASEPEAVPDGTAGPTPSRRPPLDLLPLALAALAGVAFYAGAFGLRHLQAPVADDSFFYVAAVRLVARSGLATSHLLARPALPLLGATLGSLFRTSPWGVSVALPMAMASGLGLAGAALAGRWGLRGWWAGVFAALVALSAVAARLVAGKDETLLTLWLLGAAVAAWARLDRRRGTVAAAALAFGAGLAEWPFLALFLVVVAGAAALDGLAWPRTARTGGPEPRLRDLAVASAAAAVGVGLVVVVWNGTGPGAAVQRLPPTFRYALRLRDELATLWPLPTTALFLAGWWAARRDRSARPVVRLMGVWFALAVLAVAVGLAGAKLPTYRVVTFALPLALGAAAAPVASGVAWRAASSGRRYLLAVTAGVTAALVLAPAVDAWYRDLRPRTDGAEIGQIAAAGRYAGSLPGGGPVVLVVDRRDVVLGAFYQRVAGAAVPGAVGSRVLVFMGSAGDALAGRPTLTGVPSRDELARTLFAAVRPALAAGAPILAGRDLDPEGFAAAPPEAPQLGRSVAVLRGPPPRLPIGAGPLQPLPAWWAMVLFGISALAVLAAAGIGWASLAAPGAAPRLRWCLAPAYGAVALVVGALVAERLGSPPGRGTAALLTGIAVAASAGAAVAGRRARRVGGVVR
jgi:hypothetical protein